MPWKVSHRSDSTNHVVANKIAGDLAANATSPRQMLVAKVAISDQADGDARGVLYYWTDEDPPQLTASASDWAYVTLKGTTEYDDAYHDVEDFLNAEKAIDGVKLTLQQSAAARVGFANARKDDFHLTVFYPILA